MGTCISCLLTVPLSGLPTQLLTCLPTCLPTSEPLLPFWLPALPRTYDALALQNSSVGSYNNRGFVEVLAASQTKQSQSWFQGTADAVRRYMWLFDEAIREGVEDFLILSGGWMVEVVERLCGWMDGWV